MSDIWNLTDKEWLFMATKDKELTPMQRQYHAIKEQNQDCILFFRLGDFYEMFEPKEYFRPPTNWIMTLETAPRNGTMPSIPCGTSLLSSSTSS